MDFDPLQFCLPPTIRFACSLCAACCHQWPVPLSLGDADRIAAHLGTERADLGFVSLGSAQSDRFALTLPRDGSGACRFLASDKTCTLHDASIDGLPVKPAMCTVFPYGFLPCPDGVFVSVSFASTAVLDNAGILLSETDTGRLEMIYRQYLALDTQAVTKSQEYFAADRMELVSGLALPFDDFCQLNTALVDDFVQNASRSESLDAENLDAEDLIVGFMQKQWSSRRLPISRYALDRLPGCPLDPFQLDGLLMSGLIERYMPDSGFAVDFDPHGRRMVEKVKGAMTDGAGAHLLDLSAARAVHRSTVEAETDQKIKDLLLRYCLVKIYGRIYCGIGFGELSMMAGLGHLLCLIVALKHTCPTFDKMKNALRLADAILTNTLYDRDCRSMLEIFFLDPDRPSRLKTWSKVDR